MGNGERAANSVDTCDPVLWAAFLFRSSALASHALTPYLHLDWRVEVFPRAFPQIVSGCVCHIDVSLLGFCLPATIPFLTP